MLHHLSVQVPRALCLVAAACTPGISQAGPTPSPSGRPITLVEARQPGVETAFDAVKRLRPTWLRPTRWARPMTMAQSSDPYPTVYIGDIWCGGIECLESVPADCVKEIRYLNVKDATTRWGRGHTNGVITVTLTSRRS